MTHDAPSDWLRARPDVDADAAAVIGKDRYGVTGDVAELGSQQDRNYRIAPADAQGIMLKINHPSVTPEELDLQLTVSATLLAAGVHTPAVIPTVDGASSFVLELDEAARASVCAFELVSGTSLLDAGPLTGARAEELGRLGGRTVDALAPVDHPGAERDLQWEMSRAPQVVQKLAASVPTERRDIVLAAAERAWSTVASLQGELPLQLIHGDLTTDNVMCDDEGNLWVIDLGDAVRSWRVADAAILVADVFGQSRSLAHAARAIRGFHSVAPLSESEIEAIWPMVILRGAVLVVSGYSQQEIDPGNEYALTRMDHEWGLFEQAVALDPTAVTAQFRLAVGLTHAPHITTYVPLMTDLAGAETIDLGIRSPLLDRGEWLDPTVETRLARTTVESGRQAVFRFGETRLTRVAWDVSAPAATRARVVELWSAPGTEVFAPFAGNVRADAGAIELVDAGVTLRVAGLKPAVSGAVRAGDSLGFVAADEQGLGRLQITRRLLDAAAAPLFVGDDGEYDADGAADSSVILGLTPAPDPVLHTREQQQRRTLAVGDAAERFYANPPQIERGWDTRLISTTGRAYLDLVNNVTAIGHSHPRLADAVGRQLHLLNTNSRFLYEAYADFVEKLLQHSPDPSLDTVIPVNSGSEAVELAIKLARVATGRTAVIAQREAYHGWTMAADAASTSAFDNPHALASRPDWVHLVDAPNAYRGQFRGVDAGARYAEQVAHVAARLAAQDDAPAAFISEPVLGNAGGVAPPAGYLAAAYAAVRAQGGLAIADEVQVGYGRLGTAFWGSTAQGAVPDIIAVAKAAGNAFPLGAVITRREIVDALAREGMFFSSAAGAPASAVAGSVVLDVIREEGLMQNAARVGAYLRERLEALALTHPLIGAIHGSGLYMGVELVRNREDLTPASTEAADICQRLLTHGVIVQPASERQNVLKIKPPLTLTSTDADAFVHALDRVLRELPPPRGE